MKIQSSKVADYMSGGMYGANNPFYYDPYEYHTEDVEDEISLIDFQLSHNELSEDERIELEERRKDLWMEI